jgi:hypothetical protein
MEASRYEDGAVTLLPRPPGMAMGYTYAKAINDSDHVVGWWHDTAERYRAILWHGDEAVVLDGHAGRNTRAFGINKNGTIVGGWMDDDFYLTNVLWRNGIPTDITGIPGIIHEAQLNDADQLLVSAMARDADGQWVTHLYTWDADVITELPCEIPQFIDVTGFNTHGIAIANVSGEHPIVYADGVLTDLNTLIPPDSGWQLVAAHGLNESGLIVGDGIYNGQPAAFLLTPTGLSTVPEPTCGAVIAVAMVARLTRRRRPAA